MATGALVAAGCQSCGFKDGGLAYREMNSRALSSTSFSEPFCAECADMPRREVEDGHLVDERCLPQTNAQIDVATCRRAAVMRRELTRHAQRQHHAGEAALPPRPRATPSIQTSSGVVFPSYIYLACPQGRSRRWERKSPFVRRLCGLDLSKGGADFAFQCNKNELR